MSTYLYIIDSPVADEDPVINTDGQIIALGEYNEKLRYLSAKEISIGTLVGCWNNDGTQASCDQILYEQYFREFSNIEGSATNDLNFHYFQGHKQREMQDRGTIETPIEPIGQAVYPSDNQPFTIKMEHQEITEGAWQGHGWKCTMLSADPARDITARAIGIYSDPECTSYLYTTGAFIMTDTGEVDENEEAIYRPITECPLGQLKVSKESIYFALLLGAAKEGIMVLPVETDNITRNYWKV